jgi:DUF2971 family protein
MQPWEHTVPSVLYKYLRPNRLDVLTDCRVRFSQRTAFEDDHELQPDYKAFGTLGEIWRFILRTGTGLDPRVPPNVLVQLLAESPRAQRIAIQTALRNMKSVNELGIFCLTEAVDSERMWTEYADEGKGFVIAFDTTQKTFQQLTTPGRIGKVNYSEEVLETFLGTMETEGAAVVFRKRPRYSFETEWRSIRALRRLEARPGGIFLSEFNPSSIREIIVCPTCTVEANLRGLIASDQRYGHVQIVKLTKAPNGNSD